MTCKEMEENSFIPIKEADDMNVVKAKPIEKNEILDISLETNIFETMHLAKDENLVDEL